MFRSLSISASSIPFSKSSAASFYDSSSISEKWKNLFESDNCYICIDSIKRCKISVLDDEIAKDLSIVGISILNFFGGRFDYPEHWFLIAKTVPYNIIYYQILALTWETSISYYKYKIKEKDKEEE